MGKMMSFALTAAIFAVPSVGHTQNAGDAADFSRLAVNAGSFEASRGLAAMALENIKPGLSVAVTDPVIPASSVGLDASPAMAQIRARSGYVSSDAALAGGKRNFNNEKSAGTIFSRLADRVYKWYCSLWPPGFGRA